MIRSKLYQQLKVLRCTTIAQRVIASDMPVKVTLSSGLYSAASEDTPLNLELTEVRMPNLDWYVKHCSPGGLWRKLSHSSEY